MTKEEFIAGIRPYLDINDKTGKCLFWRGDRFEKEGRGDAGFQVQRIFYELSAFLKDFDSQEFRRQLPLRYVAEEVAEKVVRAVRAVGRFPMLGR